ncbi:MAG TPA: DUF4062 domain-containing protein [Egibacteraceae bacterium]|nr:DUF4062 domain-containing protein [Egibacteraceae bacterium]
MIRTHDRRLRVYVSSVLDELAEERAAVRDAVQQHRMTPVMVEMAARPYPPPALSRAYISQSEVFVGVYWQQYGAVPEGLDVSTVDDELRLAAGMPRLLYLKRPAPDRDPRLRALVERLQNAGDVSYRSFTTAAELRDLVAEDLAVLVSERFDATTAADALTPVDAGPAPGQPRPLPYQATSFVGREDEVRELRALLAERSVRLVTLVGAGGIGKSRLAVEVARGLEDAFPDGVYFVPLARVTKPELVMAAIAAEVGVHSGSAPSLERLVSALQGRRVLLVLDNFEQVAEAAGEVGRLLSLTAEVTVLVTSRRLLRLRGEHEHRVTPLAVPPSRPHAMQEVTEADAVKLFLARAEATGLPRAALNDDEMVAVADIVRRLDGVPLAIELAAARTRLLRPTALRPRLERSLDILADALVDLPERQRSLRATMEWSYALLAPHVARLLARLSTFVDGWTLDAAEAVCPEATETVAMLDALSELVDSSLVTVDLSDPEQPRFTMLAPVRDYARQRLQEMGEVRDIDARHLAYFRTVCAEAGVGLRGHDQPRWLSRLEAEAGNLTVLAQRAVDADALEDVALVAWSVWRWIWLNDHVTAARYWMEGVVARADELTPLTRAKAFWVMGCLLYEQGSYDRATGMLTEARRVFGAHDAECEVAVTDLMIAGLAAGHGEADRAYGLWTEAADVLRRYGDFFTASVAAGSHGVHLLLNGGDADAAQQLLQSALADAERIANAPMIALTRLYQGLAALLGGEVATAAALLDEVVATSGGRASGEVFAYGLDGLAGVALARDEPVRAATLFGAAAGVRFRSGLSPWPHVRPMLDGLTEATRLALGNAEYRAAVDRGRQMTTIQARDYARAVAAPAPG